MATNVRGSNLAALVGIALIWSIASTALAVGHEFRIDAADTAIRRPARLLVRSRLLATHGWLTSVRDLSDIYARAEQTAQYRLS